MRKYLILFIISLFIWGINIPVQAASEFASGSGTKDDPWIIENQQQLAKIADHLDGSYFQINQDISLSGTWQPIGSEAAPFNGTLLGGRHTISGLNCSSQNLAGLFAAVGNSGRIEELFLADAAISGNTAGAVTAVCSGTLYRCGVINSSVSGQYAGALAGTLTQGRIECSFAENIAVTANGTGTVSGGICALQDAAAVIKDCYATGTIHADAANGIAGGLSGIQRGSVESCYASADVAGHVFGLLFGESKADAYGCIYYSDKGSPIGQGTGTAEKLIPLESKFMYTQSCYVGYVDPNNSEYIDGLSFDRIWAIYEGRQTPRLQWSLFADGEGTGAQPWENNDPYVIETAEQFDNLHCMTGGYHSNVLYVLGADIDLSAYAPWNPIAGYAPSADQEYFRGWLDGQGHTISGLTVQENNTRAAGLFGNLYMTARLSNIHLVVSDEGVRGKYYTGALAGLCDGEIKNCTVTGGAIEGESYTGGLIGFQRGDVINCHTNVSVRSSGQHTGGLLGKADENYDRVMPLIQQCSSRGEVSGSDQMTGGLIGELVRGVVSQCFSSGNVIGDGYCVGGLIGSNATGQNRVEDCYSYGSVSTVKGGYTDTIGGMFGMQNGKVKNCFAIGHVEGNTLAGSFYGDPFLGTVSNCFVIVLPDGKAYPSVSGVKELALDKSVDQASYPTYDFDTIWSIKEGTTLPYLKWQEQTGLNNNYNVKDLSYTYGQETGIVDTSLTPMEVSVEGEAEAFALTAQPPDKGSLLEGSPLTLSNPKEKYGNYLLGISESVVIRPYIVTVFRDKIKVTFSITCKDVEYGSAPNPKITTDKASPPYKLVYKEKGTDSFSADVPTELGEYVVKVYIEEDEKYQESEAETSFSIIPEKPPKQPGDGDQNNSNSSDGKGTSDINNSSKVPLTGDREKTDTFLIIMLAVVLCGLLLGFKKQITKFTQEPEE